MSIKSNGLACLASYAYSDDSDPDDVEGTSEASPFSGTPVNTASSCDGDNRSTSSTETCSSRGDASPKSTSSEIDDEFEKLLPPLTTEAYPADLQQKIDSMIGQVNAGLDMNSHIQTRKEFRNPSMLEKLIEHCDIQEFGTNFGPDVFDPHKWGKESFYERLAGDQQRYMAKLRAKMSNEQAAPKPKKDVPVQIICGTSKKTTTSVKENLNVNVMSAKVAHAKQVAEAIVANNLRSNGTDSNNARKMKISL